MRFGVSSTLQRSKTMTKTKAFENSLQSGDFLKRWRQGVENVWKHMNVGSWKRRLLIWKRWLKSVGKFWQELFTSLFSDIVSE